MLGRLAVALLAVAVWAAPGIGDAYGPRFGANSFSTSIDTVSAVEDADDYVAPLALGETLTVTVTAAKTSALLPALSLVAPDGTVTALVPPAVSEKSKGKAVVLNKFLIPTTGPWAVRVTGKTGTQGAYTVKFAIGAAKSGKLTKQHLGGADPLTRDVVIDAVDGSLLDVAVTYSTKMSPVHIGAVRDPAGGANSTGAAPVEKKGSTKLAKLVLHQGSGPYTVPLFIDSGESLYTVTTKATPQARPKAKKAVVLSGTEPFLEVRATPVRGDGGLTIHLTGSSFPVTPAPQVLFGGVAGTGVVVAADGNSLDVVAPAGAADALVDVAIIQADGQASVRPGYFLYVPLPTATGLTDAGGVSILGGSTAGGAVRTLVGTGFLAGHKVRFGGTDATAVNVVDATHVTLTTPAHAKGLVAVTVEDEFARTATASFQFEYKDPPAFAAVPYSQAFAATAGGTAITLTGTGFEATDQLRFNGANLASTFVNATTRTFNTPAIAAGVYSVALVDRFGVVATGPTFEVKDPPGFAASPYVPGFARTAGGTTITITGTGFESTDQLRFNGANIASTFQSSTRRQFVSPAISAGVYAVALVDRYGVVVNGPGFEIKDPPTIGANAYSPAFAPSTGGVTITITGTNFEAADQLRFNGVNVTSTFVNSTTRRFTSPAIATGTYLLQLVDRLGTVVTGPSFPIKDPPTFAATPYAPAFAPTAGGTTVTITGTRFEVADQLKFNGANIASTFVSSTTRTFSTPAIAAGSYAVALVDGFGVSVSGPNFDVKNPPTFGATPYSPAFAGTLGGTTITVTGTGFESADVLRFNGSVVTSIFVNSTTRRFNTPAIAAGTYSVSLTDRFGVQVSGPTFEVKDPPAFTATPYSPAYGPTAGGATITITGSGFESTDTLRVNGSTLTSTFVNSTTRRFTSPALAAGFYSVTLTDRLGQVGSGASFEVRAAPTISSVVATAGPILDSTHIAAGGGATVTVTGTRYASDTTVTLGGTSASITSRTSTQLVLTAPSAAFGTVTLVVSDAVGQSASSTALTCVGFGDETANRQPGTSTTDNLLAARGAIGDLDGDGSADDMVITSDYSGSIGSRYVFTRLFFGNGTALTDATSYYFPGVSSLGDSWSAQAVAIGDLDGNSTQDVLIAGTPFQYYGYYTTYKFEARLFTNNGSGSFSLSSYSPQLRTSAVTCFNYYGSTYNVFQPNTFFQNSDATALAIGDLDGDGDNDFVMATDHYRSGTVHINPAYVSFSPGFYYDPNASSHFSYYGTYYYTPALRIFDNQGGGFLDATFPRLPLAGTGPSYAPAMPGRDVKIGDVDGDSVPDIVVTWDQPTMTTPYGLYTYGSDSSRNCTEVLINNGSGFFSDQSYTWMPAVSYPEFWQANRMALADLDADGKNDLVLLHEHPLDGSTTTTSSLRVLQNQGTSFLDVTSSALPSVPLSGTADDNLRGTSLAVADVDGDGNLDLLVGTTEALVDSSGAAVRRTRLLRGDGALHFSDARGFLPPVSTDTGEAQDLLIGDVAGNALPSLFLLTEPAPSTSPGSERLRVFDWK